MNKDNTIEKLTAGEVKLYWLRKNQKNAGQEINKNIKPADRKTKSPEQDTFYSKVIGMSGERR